MLPKAPATGARHKRAGCNSKHDSHLLLGHLDAPHQGSDELPTRRPVRVCESFVDSLREVLHAPDDELQLRVEQALVSQLVELPLEIDESFLGSLDSRLELRLLEEALGIAIDHACDASLYFADLSLQPYCQRSQRITEI